MMTGGRVDAEARSDEGGAEGNFGLVVESHGGRVIGEGPGSSGLATTALAMAAPKADNSGREHPAAIAVVEPVCRHNPLMMATWSQWNTGCCLM